MMQIPTCPITLSEIKDPVLSTVDGYTYEKVAILAWLSNNQISPMTKQSMTTHDLIPNRAFFSHNIQERVNVSANANANSTFRVFKNSDSTCVKIIPPENTVRLPVNIMFVIDTSGSMGISDPNPNGENSYVSRLDLVVHSATTIINMLNDNDSIGIISFNLRANLDFAPLKMTSYNKQYAIDTLRNLNAGGRTYIWDGIRLALENANSDYNIVVLTDGESDIEPPRGTLEMFKNSKFTSTFHFFGYGYNLDLHLLRSMTNISGGWFAFVPDASIVGSTFVNFISHILSTAGNNIIINKTVKKGSVLFEKPKYIYNKNKINSVTINGIEYELTHKEDEFTDLSHTDNETFISLVRSKNTEALKSWAKTKEVFFPAVFETEDNPEGTGQIVKATMPEYAKKWGNIYIETMMTALESQYCPNFKDTFLFQFGDSQIFKKYQSEAEDKFVSMQIVIKSSGYQTQVATQVATQVPTQVSSTSYYNMGGG